MVRTSSQLAALELVRKSFSAMLDLGVDSCEDEEIDAFSQFNTGVLRLVHRSVDADMQFLAGLQPKLPLFTFLCRLHGKKRLHRSRITALLRTLLSTPALALWRAAADEDDSIRRELEGLGVMDSIFCDADEGSSCEEVSDDMDPHCSSRENTLPLDSTTTLKGGAGLATTEIACTYQAVWMYRDAGTYGGSFTHALASLNPARWSSTKSLVDTIKEMEQLVDTPSGKRPVKVSIFTDETFLPPVKTEDMNEAVVALRNMLLDGGGS